MRRVRSFDARGMSLVETTIILMVLALLTSVVAPAINDFVNDAKDVKVKEDCEVIGVSVMRVARDVGPCLRNLQSDPCTQINRADLLYSYGEAIDFTTHLDTSTAPDFSHNEVHCSQLNWDMGPQCGDSMESQFLRNLPSHTTPGDVDRQNPLAGYQVPGPSFYLGWRGAYLSSPIGPDPHGLPYVVNSVFLSTANADATVGSGEGQTFGGWDRDAICISAGRDRRFETPFDGAGSKGTLRTGDDFVYVISGSTR